jgi:nucleotide-binding universal stress UspA family protein
MAFPEAMPALDQAALGSAREDVRQLEARVAEKMVVYSAPWETLGFVVTQAGLARTVAETTQLVDLTVLPRPYGPETSALDETIAEAALFNGPSPVLFAETIDVDKLKDGPILVGWNETPEALAAIRAAMPLLQNASTVHITMVNPRAGGLDRSDPGGAVARFLARHGCRVEVAVLSQTLPRASDELLRHARETSSSMMVVGAYGHSRLREAVFGGATRNLLETSDIPLFMAR